jgi:hypothetical protein
MLFHIPCHWFSRNIPKKIQNPWERMSENHKAYITSQQLCAKLNSFFDSYYSKINIWTLVLLFKNQLSIRIWNGTTLKDFYPLLYCIFKTRFLKTSAWAEGIAQVIEHYVPSMRPWVQTPVLLPKNNKK